MSGSSRSHSIKRVILCGLALICLGAEAPPLKVPNPIKTCGLLFFKVLHGELDPHSIADIKTAISNIVALPPSFSGRTYEVYQTLGVLDVSQSHKIELWEHFMGEIRKLKPTFMSDKYAGTKGEVMYIGVEHEGLVFDKNGKMFVFFKDAHKKMDAYQQKRTGKVDLKQFELKSVEEAALKHYRSLQE